MNRRKTKAQIPVLLNSPFAVLRVSKLFFLILFFAAVMLPAGQGTSGVPLRDDGFSRELMTQTPQSSFQLLDPQNFSMQQSYTMSYSGGSFGSQSSAVYLNTLSYQFGIPLVLSVDVGAYNLFHSSMQQPSWAPEQEANRPQFIIPRVGLDYRPTDNVLLSLQFVNGPDALKAYGYPWGSSPYRGSWYNRGPWR